MFVELIGKWLKTGFAFKRIAFGTVMVHPVRSKETGYNKLNGLLQSVKIEEGSSDFFYQINKPRISSCIEDLSINRLSKWSVAEMHPVLFKVSPSDDEQPKAFKGEKSVVCRLELDINSSQKYSGKLEGQIINNLFDELVSLGREISKHGDIK